MAEVRPFRPFLYNCDVAGPIESLLSLPYDKLPPEKLEIYRKKSPYNICHIIRPEGEGEAKYRHAASLWQKWKQNHIVQPASQKAFYIYSQRYTLNGEVRERKGLIGLVGLTPFGEDVFPHENTFPKPKADRLALLRATETNFGQIFLVFPDETGEIRQWLEGVTTQAPLWQAQLNDLDETHTLWAERDPNICQKISELFTNIPLFIADGHHRYETALTFWREKQQALGLDSRAPSPYRYRMATLVPLESPGLTVLPTHRFVQTKTPISTAQVLDTLGKFLSWRKWEDLSSALHWLSRGTDKARFLFLFPTGDLFGGEWRQEAPLPESLSPPMSKVPVVLLHEVLLKSLLLSDQQGDEGETISFYRSAEALYKEVQRHPESFGVCLPPLPLQLFQEVTQQGLRLPQKSTDFYPKMLSGVAMYDMQACQNWGEG